MYGVSFNLVDSERRAMSDTYPRARQEQRGLGVEFTNKDVGITEKVQARIFDPFASFSETAAPNSEWPIVKRIVDFHYRLPVHHQLHRGRTTVAITLPVLS